MVHIVAVNDHLLLLLLLLLLLCVAVILKGLKATLEASKQSPPIHMQKPTDYQYLSPEQQILDWRRCHSLHGSVIFEFELVSI